MQKICFLIAAVLLAGSCSATVHKPRITFSYVVDVTGSMSGEIRMVQNAVYNFTSHLSHFRALGIDHFILVTFSDPAYLTRIYEYWNPWSLYSGTLKLKAYGGGDCPEYGLNGLEQAINKSLPNSYIFYFSDASVKNASQYTYVINAAKAKNIRIWIIATGCCTSYCSSYSPYRQIANETGGVYYYVKAIDLPVIMTYVNRNVRCRTMYNLRKPPTTRAALDHWLFAHPEHRCIVPTGVPATGPPPPSRPSGVSTLSAGVLTVVMGTIASVFSFH